MLGAAFKPNSDDIRDSPAPTLAYTLSAYEACRDADVVLHLTEWQEFRDLDPEEFGKVASRRTFRALGRPRA